MGNVTVIHCKNVIVIRWGNVIVIHWGNGIVIAKVIVLVNVIAPIPLFMLQRISRLRTT